MNSLHMEALIATEREGRRIKEFMDDPVITKFLERLELEAVARAIEGGSAEDRESHRVHAIVIRNLRNQLKLAIGKAISAAGEIAKAKERK